MKLMTDSPEGKRRIAAWRAARALHYADTRSREGLAWMLVELEDEASVCPEFELEDEWPKGVAHLKVE